MIYVVSAGSAHTPGMADLLNQIIARGGTTAMTDSVSATDISSWMKTARSAWHIAEDDMGQIIGFQWIEPAPTDPETDAEIATFTRIGQTGIGIGSALFQATESAARALGYRWINATIRSDNESGLAYYQSRGFEGIGVIRNVKLANGLIVDKVLKRYDLLG